MKPVSHFLRLAIVSLFAFSPAHADSPPAMNVRFDPGAIYLRTSRGTQEGVVNDYLGPQATTGVLCDAMDKKIGEVVNVHATEFDSILKVSRMENGKQLSDASYLALNGVEKGAFLIFTEEDSSAYFRIDKGTDQIDSKTLKRSAKGQLLDANGKMAGLCQIKLLHCIAVTLIALLVGCLSHVADFFMPQRN